MPGISVADDRAWPPNWLATLGLGLVLAAFHHHARADELTWTAAEFYRRGVAERIVPDADGTALVLASDVIYEDDGPAAGFSYRPNVETLAGNVWIKKQLDVGRPQATVATLLVGRGNDDLRLRLNDQETTIAPAGKVGAYWQAYRFEASALKLGINDFVLYAAEGAPQSGRNRMQIWIARDDEYAAGAEQGRRPPNRSFKSADGGQTWSDRNLGDKNDVDGEYYVRLILRQYVADGSVTSPVIDAGNLSGEAEHLIAPPVENLGPVKVQLNISPSEASQFSLHVRSGETFAVRKESWSEWQVFPAASGELVSPKGRYVQVKVALKADNPLATPRLNGLSISASPKRPSNWKNMCLGLKSDNPPVRRSPVPFVYEPFDEPLLHRLREQEKLDDVARGAKSQFELACAIAKWSAKRLNNLGHLGEIYPAWNALEILAPHADGTPIGGFCQQYNLLFLQACLSQGLTVRAVSVGPGNRFDRLRSGHETVELWSDDFRKWVYLDGNTGWYIKDVASGIPLSIWEVRQRQLAALAGEPYLAIELVKLVETRYDWPDLSGGFGFVEMRLLPRNNFLSQPQPLPLNQGMRGWFWPGHWVSADREEPVGTLFAHRLFRQEDAEWTLNHAHIMLEATGQPGEVRVHLDSETPGWETYLAQWNDEPENAVGHSFTRKLTTGVQRLSITPRNSRGQRGAKTFVEFTCR